MDGLIHTYIILIHSDPPSFTDHPLDTNGTVSASLHLNCTVYGHPIPDIIWTKDGSNIVDDIYLGSGMRYFITDPIVLSATERMGMLTIENLNYDDNGLYTCRANNTLFAPITTDSNPALVDVHCKYYMSPYQCI